MGRDIQLHIYNFEATGWPENISTRDLTKGILESKYKYTYSDHTIDENEILISIGSNEIILDSSVWHKVEVNIFNKIRSGLKLIRTPHPSDQSRPRELSK